MAATIMLAGCPDSPVSRVLGARCDISAECEGRCLADSAEYPGGFCSQDCNNSDECPAGAACIDRDGGVCLFTCSADAACNFLGVDWRCHDDAVRGPGTKVMTCRGD